MRARSYKLTELGLRCQPKPRRCKVTPTVDGANSQGHRFSDGGDQQETWASMVHRFALFFRRLAFLLPLLTAAVSAASSPAFAQGIDLIRDSEIERVLREYEDPILKA